MSNTSTGKPPTSQTSKKRLIIDEIGRDTKTGIIGRGYSPDNGKTFYVLDTIYGRLYGANDINAIWNNGTSDRVKKEVDAATAEIPAVKSAADEAVKKAYSAIASSKVNSDAIAAQSEANSEVKAAMDSATAEIQQTASNAASDAAKIRADVAQVQNEVDTAKAANSASVEALKSDIDTAKQDLANVHGSLTKAQSAVEQNQKLINDSVAKITSDVSATKQDLADVHDSLTKAQAAAEQNQKAIDKSIAQINDSVDATNQDLAGVRKDLTKAQSDIAANQKSINDNVAQINSNIEQDRKDIASAQQANADTAKQLDTYSKQATEQGKTIKSIQDKQDGFTATLADVQGNVSQVSDKVDGLSASLKDTQGNVASVKAQADQLSATLTDHSKSIAILTASAKELSSTLEDADGRLSKVEQTAQTNSSTLSDVQGDLSQVKQNATKLVSTLKDAQGNISTLQQKADSLSTQLASAQGDIATLQTGIDGVKAILTSHDKSIHTLQADSKSLKDSMVNAQGDISTLRKTATDVTSELEDHTGRLSKVEQSAAKQATTLSDLQGNLSQVKQQADGLVTTLKDAQGSITQIQQKADGTLAQLKSAQGDIASLQTDVTGIKATLTSHEGDIHTLQADSKTLKDDMQDAQGNISSLQKSSTKLDSEMSSQDGRLSKVEQTAKEHTSTISDLGDKLNNMKIGGRNLLHGTSDQWRTLTGSGWLSSSTASDVFTSVADYHDGDQFTYSAIITNPSTVPVRLVLYCYGTNKQRKIKTALGQPVKPGVGAVAVSITITTDWRTWFLRSNIETVDGEAPQISIQAKEEKLEAGNKATAWTPNPDDMATLTQVKQTADGIETTLKSAQGDIDQIKQNAKGTSEQLADVKGDVTNIQKDVTGLKQTTADNAGNIHTLQSDSKTLKDDMQDAQGDISTLKKTSTDVTTELKDHAGRISKTEQTASTLVNEFADQQGHLNRVEQTAQGTQQTVANQQGQINNIKTDAAGIHETLTGQGNQIANINVTLSGLNTKYDGVSGDLSKLSDKVTTNSTQIDQDKKLIALKADQTTVDNLSGEVNQNKAQLKVQADQISSKVSSTDFKTLNDRFNNMKVGGRNLLHGTSDSYRTLTGDGYLCKTTASSVFTSTATYHGLNWFTYSATITNNSTKNACLETWLFDQNRNSLTASAVAPVPLACHSQNVAPGARDQKVSVSFEITGTTWFIRTYVIFNGGGAPANSQIQVKEEQLEEGNVRTQWSPNPDDFVASIKKNSTAIDENSKLISLKANQTDVDNVKNTTQQNSSRLDVMAGEIKSKVTSTDVNNIVDSKGYATTSTVQSLITQKAGTISESITNLTSKIKDKDGINLLTGTSDFTGSWFNRDDGAWTDDNWRDTNGNRVRKRSGSAWNGLGQTVHLEPGNYTFSMDMYLNLGTTDTLNFYAGDTKYNGTPNIVQLIDGNRYDHNSPQGSWFRAVCHFKVTEAGNVAIRPELNQSSGTVHVGSYKLEKGLIATPWTPAPSDNATVTQVQSLTASLDGLKSTVVNKADTSQITQLSNLIQSKVSSNDFTSKISQLSTDINARVTKGDLLSQLNLEAGRTLIQSNKIYLDANSVIMGPNTKAFIPSAAITNVDADKVSAGTIKGVNLLINNGTDTTTVNNSGITNAGLAPNQKDHYTVTRIDNGVVKFGNVSPNLENQAINHIDENYDSSIFGNDGNLLESSKGTITLHAGDLLNDATQWNSDGTQISRAIPQAEIKLIPSVDGKSGRINLTSSNSVIDMDEDTLTIFNTSGDAARGGGVQIQGLGITGSTVWSSDNYFAIGSQKTQTYTIVNAQSFQSQSVLSSKTRIKRLDRKEALSTIMRDDIYTYLYKSDVQLGLTKRHASLVIDDENDVAQYRAPEEFISENGNARDDGTQLGYLIAAVQYQQEQIEELKKKLEEK